MLRQAALSSDSGAAGSIQHAHFQTRQPSFAFDLMTEPCLNMSELKSAPRRKINMEVSGMYLLDN